MSLSAERVLEDLVSYVKCQVYVLSSEALKVFTEVEYLCRENNVCPFSDEFFLVLLKETPLLQQIIKKYGGDPDLALPVLYKKFEERDESNSGFDYDSSELYSNEHFRKTVTRSRILDFAIESATKRRSKEIGVIELIEAILNYHEENWPVWENGNYFDERIYTPFNTISHVAGVYCEYLWVNLEDVRKELKEIEKYDLAISFAGEDREIARNIAELMSQQEFKVFFDEYENAELWGKDLYSHLSEVYSKKAKFCLMIVSKNYACKQWTNIERKAAQAKAFQENSEYILPLRLDDTEIPGLLPTIGYIDLRQHTITEVVELLKKKIRFGQHIA